MSALLLHVRALAEKSIKPAAVAKEYWILTARVEKLRKRNRSIAACNGNMVVRHFNFLLPLR